MILHLLTEISPRKVRLCGCGVLHRTPLPISGPALSAWLARNPNLEALFFQFYILDEHHCRALASRVVTDKCKDQLRVQLFSVAFTIAGRDAFVETLQLSQGPNLDLVGLSIDAGSLASALTGNSTVKSIEGDLFSSMGHCEPFPEEMLAFAQALGENKGLEKLCLPCDMPEKTWQLLCESIQGHPALQELDLGRKQLDAMGLAPIFGLLHTNTVLRTVHLAPLESCRRYGYEPTRNQVENEACNKAVRVMIESKLLENLNRPRVPEVR